MGRQPTARVLWQIKMATIERQVTVNADQTSMSLRVNEVTMVAAADIPLSTATDACIDLELGAHVALLHRLTPEAHGAPAVRSPCRSLAAPGKPPALEPV
jgi:hypothetical protein